MRRGRDRDDLASTDEVKVYKYEDDDENRASENLSEDKLGLVNETEEGKGSELEGRRFLRNEKTPERRGCSAAGSSNGTVSDYSLPSRLSFPLITPYPPYLGSSPLSLAGVALPQHGALPYFMYNSDLLGAQPPPAHMRFAPLQFAAHPGLSAGAAAMYGLPGGSTPSPYGLPPSPHSAAAVAAAAAAAAQLANSFYAPPHPPAPADLAHHMSWPGAGGYGMPFGSPYSPYHSSGVLGSMHPGLPYPGVSHPALVASSQDTSPPRTSSSIFARSRDRQPSAFVSKHHHHSSSSDNRCSQAASRQPHRVAAPVAMATSPSSASQSTSSSATCRTSLSHVKKPLNAFMLFMKEMRQKVIEECTLKESAAINQILGRKWHSLNKGEQARYYDMARREKELHHKRYPTWSARDNYAMHSRRRRKRLDHRPLLRHDGLCDDDEGVSAKKCRARYGLDQQSQWCKPCRRKKRCIRFIADGENEESSDEADNVTAVGSVPLAADSTTEIFSPMPLSSSSSSNPDDPLALGNRPSGGGETESQSSVSSGGVRSVEPLCDNGLSSMSCAVNVPRLSHIASTPSASGSGGGLISSTIVEH